jgi:hypothetical protein
MGAPRARIRCPEKRGRLTDFYRTMTDPPATSSTTPVIHDALSEARKTAARATSSGVPSRLSGWASTSSLRSGGGMR